MLALSRFERMARRSSLGSRRRVHWAWLWRMATTRGSSPVPRPMSGVETGLGFAGVQRECDDVQDGTVEGSIVSGAGILDNASSWVAGLESSTAPCAVCGVETESVLDGVGVQRSYEEASGGTAMGVVACVAVLLDETFSGVD